MTVAELIHRLKVMPHEAEILVDIERRYAEIDNITLEHSQRVNERKPYVVVSIFGN